MNASPDERPTGAARGKPTPTEPFSQQLQEWLRSSTPKTLGTLGTAFGEKSFAVAILLLMFLPALPLPTGGISHVFEIIAALLALQMTIGRTSIWLPKRWSNRQLGALTTDKAIPLIKRWIGRLELISRPRGVTLLRYRLTQRVIGLSLIATSITALTAPPFSGLDTLPGIAAVLICLGVILGDIALVAVGLVIEASGVLVILTIGAAAAHWIRHLLG